MPDLQVLAYKTFQCDCCTPVYRLLPLPFFLMPFPGSLFSFPNDIVENHFRRCILADPGSPLYRVGRHQDHRRQGLVRLERSQVLESDGLLQHVHATETCRCSLIRSIPTSLFLGHILHFTLFRNLAGFDKPDCVL